MNAYMTTKQMRDEAERAIRDAECSVTDEGLAAVARNPSSGIVALAKMVLSLTQHKTILPVGCGFEGLPHSGQWIEIQKDREYRRINADGFCALIYRLPMSDAPYSVTAWNASGTEIFRVGDAGTDLELAAAVADYRTLVPYPKAAITPVGSAQ